MSSLYRCDKSFYLPPSRTVRSTTYYGLVLAFGEQIELYVGTDTGQELKKLASQNKRILTRHQHGGQSQNRLSRLQTESVDAFLDVVHDLTLKHLIGADGVPIVAGVVLAGSGHKRLRIAASLDPRLQKVYLGALTMNDNNCRPQDLFVRAQEFTRRHQQSLEDKNNLRFLDHFDRGDGMAVYGDAELDKALSAGLLAELFLASDTLPQERQRDRTDRARAMGTTVHFFQSGSGSGARMAQIVGAQAGVRWFPDYG